MSILIVKAGVGRVLVDPPPDGGPTGPALRTNAMFYIFPRFKTILP